MTNNYRQLKDIILLQSYDRCDFLRIKERFESVINSPRTFEQVQSLQDLIKVLESRAVLCEKDVSVLNDIVDFLPRKEELRKAIKKYQLVPRKSECNGNYYSEETNQNANLSLRKKNLIYDKLCNELGRYWRDFARNLNVREGKIDEINAEHKSFQDKILKVLNIHEYNMPFEDRWFYEIITALERARRKDLSKLLKEINLLDF